MLTPKLTRYLIACCILAAVVGSAVFQIWSDYRETQRLQETTVRDISIVVDAQIHTSVQQAETMLGLLADLIQANKELENLRQPASYRNLKSYCAGLTGCKSIVVADPAGRVVALSDTPDVPNFNVADRVYFQLAKKTGKLFVGPAVVSRVAGSPILFSIARPVYDTSGTLLAIITAGMTTSHLTEFYGLLGFNVSPAITVFKGNGDMVAHQPDINKYVGGNFASDSLFTKQLPQSPAGIYRSASSLDGKMRIASYRSIPDWDLVVYSGIGIDDAFQQWRVRTWRTVVTGFLALCLIYLILYFGFRSTYREYKLRKKNVELNRLTNLDGLTAIGNRRFFDATLKKEWARYLEEGNELSLLLIDVDYFKLFNDTYGHQSGDECLKQVAAALKASYHRDIDMVARYGGEEFAAILTTDLMGASAVGERMRRAVEALAIPHSASPADPVVTISIGVASVSSSKARNPAELIKAADAALYKAKQCGRNQIQWEQA
ncbi:MAG: sensor domain-containing diguanylate cyclase [Pseudomonadota bacterium]